MRSLLLVALVGSMALGGGCASDVQFAEGMAGEGNGRSTGGALSGGGAASGGQFSGSGSAPDPGDGGGTALGGDSSAGGGTEIGAGGKPGAGGRSGIGGSPSGLSAEEFCDGLLQRYCAYNEDCYGTDCSVLIGIPFGVVQGCLDATAAVGVGLVDYDEQSARGCLDAVAARECSEGPGGYPGPLCPSVFQGKLSLGDECAAGPTGDVYDECATGYCQRETVPPYGEFACRGSCVSYQEVGEDCSDQACGPDLYCSEGRCVTLGQEGDICEASPCVAPLICAWGSPRTCQEVGVAGASCNVSAECEPGVVCYNDKCTVDQGVSEPCEGDESCGAGLYCHQEGDGNLKCKAPNQPGIACDSNDRCIAGYACTRVSNSVCDKAYGAQGEPCGVDGCEAGLFCDPDQNYDCVPVRGSGGACLDHASCGDALFCMSDSKCHAPGDKSEPCSVATEGTCKTGLFCDRQSKTCLEPRAVGEPCNPMTPADSCQPGAYCACLDSDCPSAYNETPDSKYLCVAQKADGETCSNAYECEGTYCVALGWPRKCASETVSPSECSR